MYPLWRRDPPKDSMNVPAMLPKFSTVKVGDKFEKSSGRSREPFSEVNGHQSLEYLECALEGLDRSEFLRPASTTVLKALQ